MRLVRVLSAAVLALALTGGGASAAVAAGGGPSLMADDDSGSAPGDGISTGPATATPAIDGSIVQPWLIDGLSPSQLASEDATLTHAGLTSQLLQWTADSRAGTTVYPTGLPGYTQSTRTDVLGRTLSAADTAGLTEYVGLQVNDDWWSKHADDSTWLGAQATLANQLADDIAAGYAQHASFGGWYLPFEVDNLSFTTPQSWSALSTFYGTVANHLHALTPGLPVIIAPFFNASTGLSPSQWTTMWQTILANAPIDALALQDGVGAGHATTSQLATWYAATAAAIGNAGVPTALWADAETFTTTSDTANYPSGFRPLDIGTVAADLAAEAPYVSTVLSFSYDHYDSPVQVSPAYDRTYRGYLKNGRVETTAPTRPTGLGATASGPLTVQLGWTAATDANGVVGYQVSRGGVAIATVYSTAVKFIDVGLNPGTRYTYMVAALDAAGNVSPVSATASVTTPAGPSNPVNFAAGRSYTATVPASSAYPDSGGELTDGVLGSASYTDPAWQGRFTNSAYSFTVDLGSTRTVREVDSDWLQVQSVSITLPATLTVATSTDGKAFTTAGTIGAPTPGAPDQSATYRLLGLAVSARYVRVSVTPSAGAWSFTDELQVRGTK